MSAVLLLAGLLILLSTAAGLALVLRGPGRSERLMAVQLLATGGIALLLILAAATGEAALLDVALVLALLGAFAAAAFVLAARLVEER